MWNVHKKSTKTSYSEFPTQPSSVLLLENVKIATVDTPSHPTRKITRVFFVQIQYEQSETELSAPIPY